MKIPTHSILPNPEQPRTTFGQAELQSLADSIRVNGLVNAIAVEEADNGTYILIDGERRWRAHKLLGLKEIEATVRPSQNGNSAKERLVLAMVANLHRSDLSPIEEGRAFRKMVEMGMTYNTIAYQAGASLPTIANRLKLLELEPEVQDLVDAGKLPVSDRSTTALLSIKNPEAQVKMAQRCARPGIRIQTIEKACANYNQVLERQNGPQEVPAVELARKSSRSKNNKPAWSALQQVGQLPPWSLVRAAADNTCRGCALIDLASKQTCRDCPAVELIRRLMEQADEQR